MVLIIEELLDITNAITLEEASDAAAESTITENQYIEMAEDFKLRMISKNITIQKLQKKLILIYALVERYMEMDDPAFIEEARYILDKALIDNLGVQDIE